MRNEKPDHPPRPARELRKRTSPSRRDLLVRSSGAIVATAAVFANDSAAQRPSSAGRGGKATSGDRPDVRFTNPPTMPAARGYTQVVEVTGGRTVYVSGQIALDRAGNVVGQGDLRAQTRQVFENIKAALEAAGGSFADVVKLNVYMLDISQIQVLREVRDAYVNTKNPPASTAVEVRRLFRDELLIEVDATAVVKG